MTNPPRSQYTAVNRERFGGAAPAGGARGHRWSLKTADFYLARPADGACAQGLLTRAPPALATGLANLQNLGGSARRVSVANTRRPH